MSMNENPPLQIQKENMGVWMGLPFCFRIVLHRNTAEKFPLQGRKRCVLLKER